MGFAEAVTSCFSKYVTFSGRAPRSEFWWYVLFVFIGSIVFSILDATMFSSGMQSVGFLGLLWTLVTLLPSISVAVRRLHDTNRSGWWYWLFLVPLIGFIILIIWFASVGSSGSNRFGHDPLADVYGDDRDEDFVETSVPTVDRH